MKMSAVVTGTFSCKLQIFRMIFSALDDDADKHSSVFKASAKDIAGRSAH